MKILTSTVLFIYMVHRSSGDNGTYTSKYDDVNVDEILSNGRMLNGYVNCLTENTPCTPDAKELKRNLPDAIKNNCEKCTTRQRQESERVMQYMIDNKPDEWAKLEKKYDPEGNYRKNYLQSKSQATSKTGFRK